MKTPDSKKPEMKGKPKPQTAPGPDVRPESAPKPKSPEKQEAINKEKEKFAKKSEQLKTVAEKKGGLERIASENSSAITSGGLFLIGLLTGALPFMFLGGWLFHQDSKSEKKKTT